jgi:hypothetical protein
MNKQKLIQNLYSKEREKVNKAVKEIKKNSWEKDNEDDKKEIFKKILDRYESKDKENVKITIRGLNAALYIGIPLDYLKRYKDILLNNITSTDGTVRRTINSVMDGYRSIFLTGIIGILGAAKKQIYTKEETDELNKLNVDSYVELTVLYEKEKDEKIKSSIMSAFKRFHCMAFYELVDNTQHKEIYKKYAKPQLPPMNFDLHGFIPLQKLLKEDTEEVKHIKSLYEKEHEYSDFLGEIEHAIAEYFYYEDENIKDEDIKNILKKIKENYLKDLNFFKHELEIEIMEVLSEVLEEYPITHHELKLILDYLLWAIDNRTWMQDKQAYVKWIAYSHELYDSKEAKEYEESIEDFGKRMGMPQSVMDTILLRNDDFNIDDEQKALGKEESEFFSMDDKQKFSFLMEKGTHFANLINDFFIELAEKGDYSAIDKFYNEFTEQYPDFIPIYILMAQIYFHKNPILAKHYIEYGMNELDNADDMPEGIRKKMKDMLETAIKNIGDKK